MYKNCHPYALWFLIGLATLVAMAMACQGLNHDQMIFYQAGLRSWAGQIPYRDYSVPQGPIAGLVFALFLRLVPSTGGVAFLAASAALNSAATFLIFRLVHRATGNRELATAAGAVTALWYLSVFGSYYNDHLAYVGVLAMALAWVDERWWLAGVLAALTYHTKQTVAIWGGLALPLCDLAVYRGQHARGWVRFACAMLVTHALVFGAILAFGGGSMYWRTVVRAPLQFAARSEGKSPWRILTFLVLPWNIVPWRMIAERGVGRLAFYPVALTAYAAAWTLLRKHLAPRAAFLLAFLTLSTLWGAAWLGRFHGQLFFGMAGVAALVCFAWDVRARWLALIGIPLAVLNVAVGGPFVRTSSSLLRDTDLWPIRFERSQRIENNAAVAAFLQDKPGALAMAGGDTYYVAAALRRAPWNPTVYFEFPLTVPLTADLRTAWEADFENALERHRVQYVVADIHWSEKDYVAGTKLYVMSHYHPVFSAGNLRVLQRN